MKRSPTGNLPHITHESCKASGAGHWNPFHKWVLPGLLILFLASAPSNVAFGQADGGPTPTNPPQLSAFGSALAHLRTPWIEDQFSQKKAIAGWKFFHAGVNGPGDIYLGSVLFSPNISPPMLAAGPAIPAPQSTDHIRYVYFHANRSIPPNPLSDVVFSAPVPYNLPRRSMPTLVTSLPQLDLLIQICEWQQPGQSPPQLQGFKNWLEEPNTAIVQIRAYSFGLQTCIELTGRQTLPDGTYEPVAWIVSAEVDSLGIISNLEVTP